MPSIKPNTSNAVIASAAAKKSFPKKAMEKLGLVRDIDLALHLPLRYEDETQLSSLCDATIGEMVQIKATVVRVEVRITGKKQLLVWVSDGTESCLMRFFHFYPALQKNLSAGSCLYFRGELRGGFDGLTMLHPQLKSADATLPTKLTPIYPASTGLAQSYLRKAIDGALLRVDVSEIFTKEELDLSSNFEKEKWWRLKDVLLFLHHPKSQTKMVDLENRQHGSWQRLKMEELLAQQLSQLLHKKAREKLKAPSKKVEKNDVKKNYYSDFFTNLPFKLTLAQLRVLAEIAHDLHREVPMHRLLQGDVGAGKTVVAALAACHAIDAGWQCALMAPTEILVEQHLRKLAGWLAPLGLKIAWLMGAQKAKERRDMLAQIESGEAHLVIGTHAMIQGKVKFKRLGLAIIDEQHRFGVAQRLTLRQKLDEQGYEPHLLMMTATPIPRTLAMSYYADLDVSTIDELPPGRMPIVTKAIHEIKRAEVIARIRLQIEQGRQVYWVCPLIEESEALDLSNATATYNELVAFMDNAMGVDGQMIKVGLLHSRMTGDEKKGVMADFSQNKIALLVCTTVIEVGVDVPNATLMVIEHAERFGLSQLHQLRGRVGRGAIASACVLLYATGDAPRLSLTAQQRIKAMVETTDGFEISKRDLMIRGPGEMLGSRQSGAALLRFADLNEDLEILEWARRVAPHLLTHHPEKAMKQIERWVGIKTDYLWA